MKSYKKKFLKSKRYVEQQVKKKCIQSLNNLKIRKQILSKKIQLFVHFEQFVNI